MKVTEFFKKGEQIFIITEYGVKVARYIELARDINGQNRTVFAGPLVGYKDQYGTIKLYDYFPESSIFHSKEAVAEFLASGKMEDRTPVVEHESLYNVNDTVYSLCQTGIKSEVITSIEWRLGQFEYHTNGGGAARYFERAKDSCFKTREEAINKLMSL